MYRNIQNIRKRHKVEFFDKCDLYSSNLKTLRGEQLCIYDSIDNKNGRIAVFGTMENLADLSNSDVLIADGTFKVTPNEFYQLYIVHGRIFLKILPLVYILTENKLQTSYEMFLKILKDQPDFKFPKNIVIDFELAAYKAFQNIANESNVYFCLFHFGQCVWRKIQKLGLTKLYTSNLLFRLYMKCYLSLAFVPVESVNDEYAKLIAEGKTLFPETDMEEFFNYFQSTFLTELYPITSWNARFRIFNNMPLTTNSAECFNKIFTSRFDQNHSGIHTFVEKLKAQQSLVEQDIETLMLNPASYKQSNTTVEKYTRIKEICENYPMYRGTTFLRAIAKAYNWKLK